MNSHGYPRRLAGREWKRPENCADSPVLLVGLGMVPAAAVTFDVTNGLVMGVTLLLVLACTGVVVSALRKWIPPPAAVPVVLIVAASATSAVTAFLRQAAPETCTALGIYLPITAVNAMVLIRCLRFSLRQSVGRSLADCLALGGSCLVGLCGVAVLRQSLGTDAVFRVSALGGGDPIRAMVAPPVGLICIALAVIAVRLARAGKPGGHR